MEEQARRRAAHRLDLEKIREIADEQLTGLLLVACSAHDPEPELQTRVIRHLIRHGVSVDETDKNGVTPLHRAVRFRSPSAVEALISAGADVNAIDRRSRSTPLHRVVTHTGAPGTAGKLDTAVAIAKILLANGADPDIENRNGKRAIDYVKNPEMRAVFLAPQ